MAGDIHMGENSLPKPESDFILKSLSICLKKSGFEKVSVSVSKTFSLKKSLGIGLKNIWSQKKSRYRSPKYLVSKKVSVSVSDEISGLVTQ